MMKRNRSVFVFFALALLCLSAASLFGQVNSSAALRGTVTDKTKAVIPNADVKILNKETGLERATATGQEGLYQFDLLPAGHYEIRISMKGFSTALIPDVELSVGQTTAIDASLSPSSQAETVTVEASAPLVDVQKTDVSRAVTPAEVENLPLNGRDFANLAFLAPGAKPVNSYDPTKNRIAIFGVNGSAGRNVNLTVNGIDDKDNTVGGPVMQLPLEAVEEFNISTQRFSASNGRSEGAAISLITKSGTNQYHGSLYLLERDTSLDANDYFSKQNKQPTADYSRQQYGGSFGMPIVHDKTFVFFALERQRELSAVTVTSKAFTELTLAKPLGAQPSPTLPTPYNDQRYNGRLDHRFSSSEAFSLSYNNQENRGLNDQATSVNDLTAGNFTTNRLILANASLNSVLSPSIVNTFTTGYQYWNNLIDAKVSVPYLSFPSAAFGTNPNVPQQSVQKKWQFRDDLSINHGKHAFKMGFDYVGIPKLGGFFNTPSTLNVTFNQDPSTILGDTTKYPLGFATPGLVTAMSASTGNSHFDDKSAKMLGFYFQDDWKLTRRFNLSLGLRWDEDFNLQGGNLQALDRTYLALKAINSPYAGIPGNDGKDFSPRLGFAWDVTGSGKHVVRGGYGIYFGQTFQNIPLFAEQQVHPDSVFTQVLQLSSTGPGDANASIVPGTNIRLSNYRYGIDPLPLIPPAATTLGAGAVGRLVNPDFKNPYNQEFNLGYSWQLSNNDMIQVEGIHSLALREAKRININPTRFATGTKDLDAAFVAAGLPKLAQIIVESSVGRSRYDALNVSFTHRLNRHFSVNTNYVFSRALGYAGGPAQFGNVAMNPDKIFDPAELSRAPNDEKHRWVFSGYAELPWGIKLAPIIQLASPRRWNGAEGTDAFGYGSGNGTARILVLKSDPTNYTATKAFTAAQLRAGIGDGSLQYLPFDFFEGNNFFQLDLRVSKTITIAERHKIEFICQMFNVSNRANFGNNYTTSIKSANFGLPSNFLSTSGTVVPHAFVAEMGFRYHF
jgi:hypothetical protein